VPHRDVTLKDVTWRTNPPTDKECSILYGGCEHFFELRLSYKPYALQVRVFRVVSRRGLLYVPPPQFDQMRKLALWVMLAGRQKRDRVYRDVDQGILRPLEEYEKPAQLALL